MPGIPYRPKKKVMRFMLMPLVDVIFLLLTFFILASRIAPYSSITLGEYAQASGSEGGAVAPGEEARPDLVLSVARGEVRANGQTLTLAGFARTASMMREAGAENVIVLTRSSATVQDIVSVLEALKQASFKSVTVRTRPSTQ